MELLQVEAFAQCRLAAFAQVHDLLVAAVVAGQLHRGERRAAPLFVGFLARLEGLARQQVDRLRLVHAVHVHAVVEDRVGHAAQVPLRVHQPHLGGVVAITRFEHHALAIDGPAFDHRAIAEQGLDQRRRTVRMHQLRVVARNRFVDIQDLQDPLVVLAQAALGLRRAQAVHRRDVVVRLVLRAVRARRIDARAGHAALVHRRFAHFERLARVERQQVMLDHPVLQHRNLAPDLGEEVLARDVAGR